MEQGFVDQLKKEYMNKTLNLFIFLSVITNTSSLSAQKISSQYEQVLYDFIEKKDSTTKWIIVKGITNNYNYPLLNKKFHLEDGVYYFFKPSSHSFYYLFSFSQNTIKVYDDLGIDSLLTLYEVEKRKYKDSKKRLILLEGLLKVFVHNNRVMDE